MNVSSSVFIKGTCRDMCPARERKLREKEGLLHALEFPAGTKTKPPLRASPDLTVKSFSRSAAGQHTPRHDELRPPDILYKTVRHLLTNIVQREVDWCIVYDFMFDRLRAVRQDLVIQGLSSSHSITVLEPIVRFHSYAGYRLCAEPLSKFDPAINCTHLLECLKRLLVLYDELQHTDSSKSCDFNIRAEMEALYLVLGLGNNNMLTRALHLPMELRQHPTVRTAFAISLASWHGNFVRVCRMLPQLPPLLMCVAAQELPNIRRKGLQVMSTAYSSRNLTFPLSELQSLLLYQTPDEADVDCRRYSVSVKEDSIIFNKGTFKLSAHGPCLRVECADTALKSCDLPHLLLQPQKSSSIAGTKR